MRFLEVDGRGRRPLPLDGAKVLGEGGAGRIHAHPTDASLVVKIYKDGQAAGHRDKVLAMLASPPDGQTHRDDKGRDWVQIAWPRAAVEDERGVFRGFTMPKVDFAASTQLDQLLQARDRRAEGLSEAYQYRLYAARNLAGLMTELHKRGHHMIDMKPQNLRVYRETMFLALLDCDGFSVDRGRFPAALYTPDYLCPEGFSRRPEDLGADQDLFALAVLLFQLLNNGVHPFVGRPAPGRADDVPPEIAERVARGLYAYDRRGGGLQTPQPMSLHAWLEDATLDLFDRAFLPGRLRPTAKEWRDHLDLIRKGIRQCQVQPNHQHFSKGCGLCVLERGRTGRPARPVQMAAPPPVPPPPRPQARTQPPPPPVRPTVVPPPAARPRRGKGLLRLALALGALAAAAYLIQGGPDLPSPPPAKARPPAVTTKPAPTPAPARVPDPPRAAQRFNDGW